MSLAFSLQRAPFLGAYVIFISQSSRWNLAVFWAYHPIDTGTIFYFGCNSATILKNRRGLFLSIPLTRGVETRLILEVSPKALESRQTDLLLNPAL